MNETLLFEIGAVIFLAVVTAVFLYGLMAFRDWQDRDDSAADGSQPARVDERLVTAAIHDTVVEPTTPAHRPATEVTGHVWRPSAA
jgi:hypothetical protein